MGQRMIGMGISLQLQARFFLRTLGSTVVNDQLVYQNNKHHWKIMLDSFYLKELCQSFDVLRSIKLINQSINQLVNQSFI